MKHRKPRKILVRLDAYIRIVNSDCLSVACQRENFWYTWNFYTHRLSQPAFFASLFFLTQLGTIPKHRFIRSSDSPRDRFKLQITMADHNHSALPPSDMPPLQPPGMPPAEEGVTYEEIREQDRYLPVANIARIMKNALPENAKIAKDSKETFQECVSEFISFITSEASDKCLQEKRKTINGDDLLWGKSKAYQLLKKYRESLPHEPCIRSSDEYVGLR